MENGIVPPARAARRTRMAPAERRGVILAAASEMFRRHGFAGASVDAIAAASGVSGPAIYRYFSGKTELLLALLETAVTQAVASLEASPGAGVEAMAGVLARHAIEEGAIVSLLQGTVADMSAADLARLERLRGDAVASLVRALRNGRPGLTAAQGEARIVAALAVVGQAERFVAAGGDRNDLRSILIAIFSV